MTKHCSECGRRVRSDCQTGMCKKCFVKSPAWIAKAAAWKRANPEAVAKSAAKYWSRPDVKERVLNQRRERYKTDSEYREKRREITRSRRNKQTPEQQKDERLRHVYGIGLAEVLAMEVQQNHCCALCGDRFEGSISELRPKKGYSALSPVLDHQHNPFRVRAVLHSKCNASLGHYESLRELAEAYLKKF